MCSQVPSEFTCVMIDSLLHQTFRHKIFFLTCCDPNPPDPQYPFFNLLLVKTSLKNFHWWAQHSLYLEVPLTNVWSPSRHLTKQKPTSKKFEICQFELCTLKIPNYSILFFRDLKHYWGPKTRLIDPTKHTLGAQKITTRACARFPFFGGWSFSNRNMRPFKSP